MSLKAVLNLERARTKKKKESIKHKTSSATSESKTRDKLLHVNIDV